MTDNVALLAYAAIWVAAIAGAVHLTINDHPFVAAFLLLVVTSISFKTGKDAERDE